MSNLKLVPDEPLIDATELARRLAVSRSWIYQQVQGGRLPHLRVGGMLRFVFSEVLASLRGDGRAA
jgi:excisionase family DNA binding protein